ncbi:MAG: histidinol-phosphate transaminase [Kiritimatiellia bacterium]
MTSFSELANPWIKQVGVYEPGKPVEEVARELGFSGADEITKLASNENALGPSRAAIETIKRAAATVHRYPDGGAFYFKRALAEKLGVGPGQLLAGNGSNELLELIGHVFLGEGRSIVMAEQAFVVYRLVAQALRTEVIGVPMKKYTHDLEAMLSAIRPDTRVVFIANPNNPTGTMLGENEIARFMENVPEHVVVCLDEAYIDLVDPPVRPDTLAYVRENGRKVIILRTFSKTHGLAGLRIGWGAASEECIELLNRVRQPFNVNSLALAAATAALEDEDHVRKTRHMIREGLEYFEKSFQKMGLEFVPSVVNFMLVRVGHGRDVFERLMRSGIIVRPMDGYGLPEHIRVTVGTPGENRRFVKELEKALRG